MKPLTLIFVIFTVIALTSVNDNPVLPQTIECPEGFIVNEFGFCLIIDSPQLSYTENIRIQNLENQLYVLQFEYDLLQKKYSLWHNQSILQPSEQPEIKVNPSFTVNGFFVNFLLSDVCGRYWYLLDTGSMKPVMGKNVEVVGNICFKEINVGDIIVFNNPKYSYPLIHQVINVVNEKYVTKGFNNEYIDPYLVSKNDVVAVVIGIIY